MKRLVKGLSLGLIAGAAISPAVSAMPEPVLGVGSRLVFNRDLTFKGPSAIFCDGGEVNPLKAIVSKSCCELRMGVPVRLMTEVTVRADRPRVVNYVNDQRTQVMIDVDTETMLRCRSGKVSVDALHRAFGELLHVEELVPPAEPSTDSRIEI